MKNTYDITVRYTPIPEVVALGMGSDEHETVTFSVVATSPDEARRKITSSPDFKPAGRDVAYFDADGHELRGNF
jgi:hypothetical protein